MRILYFRSQDPRAGYLKGIVKTSVPDKDGFP